MRFFQKEKQDISLGVEISIRMLGSYFLNLTKFMRPKRTQKPEPPPEPEQTPFDREDQDRM